MLTANTHRVMGQQLVMYHFGEAGDELPLHEHDYAHLSIPIDGRFEAYDDAGKTLAFDRGSHPFGILFEPARKHGIRAATAGAVLLNILQPGAQFPAARG
jgi:quercetin dioxygenase-like cupin family protein